MRKEKLNKQNLRGNPSTDKRKQPRGKTRELSLNARNYKTKRDN